MLSTARHARDGTTSDDRLRRKARCELETGKRLLELPKLKNEPASVAWSPDGKFLLVGTTQDPSNPERENLLLFDAGSGRLIRAWQGHGATVRAVVFSPDGTRAASCSGRRPDDVRWEVDTSVRIWSVPDGRGLWAQSIGSGGRFAADVAYSPDGHTVLAGGFAGKLVAWDAATGGVRWSTKLTDDVLGVAFSPGGELAAAATGDGRIEAFWADTGRPLAATHSRTLLFGGERSVSFSPDGRVVLAAAGNAVRLWPLLDAVASRPVSGPAEVMAGAVSPDGRLVLTSEHMYQQWGRPKPVTVADAATGLPVATAFGSRVPDGVTDRSQDQHAALAAFLPDGRSILLAEQEGGLGIWDLGLGRRLRALEPWPGRRAAAVAVCSDGRYAVARFWGEDDLQLYDLPTGARLRGLEMEGAKIVDRMAFAPDGSCVAAGSREGLVRAWDPATGRERWSRRFGRVNSIAFSPDGRLLACGGEDALHVLDAGTGRTVAGGPWPQHVWSVGFSPDGRHVLAGGEQHDAVVLWEYATGAVRRASRLPDAWVFDWAFSRDGTRLLISQGETSLLDLDYPSAIRRSEAGVRQARERLAADGNDAEALATLGRWYAARGLPDRAAELFERARGAGANVPQDVLARCYWVTGDAARAAVEYGQAAEAAERAGRADEAAYLRLCLAAVGRSPAERPESLADACVGRGGPASERPRVGRGPVTGGARHPSPPGPPARVPGVRGQQPSLRSGGSG